MEIMLARVAHIFGIERLGLGVLRSGNPEDFTPHASFGSRMYPRYILSFTASVVSFFISAFDVGFVLMFVCFL